MLELHAFQAISIKLNYINKPKQTFTIIVFLNFSIKISFADRKILFTAVDDQTLGKQQSMYLKKAHS